MADKIPTITKEQLAAYETQRVTECLDKINALLAEYDCELFGAPQFAQDGRVVALVQIRLKK